MYSAWRRSSSQRCGLDLIGSDDVDCPEFHTSPRLNFLNLRGDQRPDARLTSKVTGCAQVLRQAYPLCGYRQTENLPHPLEQQIRDVRSNFSYALLQALGKKIVLTVHNVNAAKRDSKDSFLNRLTLRIQYRLADHIFVHTEKMKLELIDAFGVPRLGSRVIPFGINNSVPDTSLTQARPNRTIGHPRQMKRRFCFSVASLPTRDSNILSPHSNSSRPSATIID